MMPISVPALKSSVIKDYIQWMAIKAYTIKLLFLP